MPYTRESEDILADWRSAERALSNVPVGTPEAVRLHAEVGHLRDEYQRLSLEAVSHDQPALPPFPLEPKRPANEGTERAITDRSNQIVDVVAEVQSLEMQKREQPIASPRFNRLADQIVDRSRRLFRLAEDEESLGEGAEAGEASIDDIDRRKDG